MATLYINRADYSLKTEANTLIVQQNGQRQTSLPIKLIERVVIQHNTQIETNLLLKLTENGASILLLSARHSRKVAIILGPQHNDAAIRLAQAQQILNPQHHQPLARQIVSAKIQRQTRFLQHAQSQRPDSRHLLHHAISQLQSIHRRIQETTPDNTSLRGYEGAAARAYFQGYASILPPSLGFTARNRRPPRDPVNACLSLAYTLLHFDAVRAAHSAGLDPLLGFYHRPAFGRESLASDLIEPLRPQADAWIWQQFRQRDLRPEYFSYDQQACLLSKAGREHFYNAWEQHAPTHRRWLRQQTTTLARQLRNQGQPWLQSEHDSDDENTGTET